MKTKFLEIKKEIEKANSIILTGHLNPDGDAVGSGLALLITLKNEYKDKNIRFILQDDIPYTTKFLNFSEEIEKFDENLEYEADLLIYLDSATDKRTGVVSEKIKRERTINIDHHISNPEYANINYVSSDSSSTCEIIYNFIKVCNYKLLVDVGSALYLGVVNDTGNFSHSNVKKSTLDMAGELVGIGVNNNHIITNFLNSNSYATLKLTGEALTNFKYYSDKKLSYFYLDMKTLKKYNGKKEDTEGIVEKILSYSEAEVSLFLREEENGLIKGSMRSKFNVDVNNIANTFDGGGHIKAAGFSSSLPAKEILEIVLEKIKN